MGEAKKYICELRVFTEIEHESLKSSDDILALLETEIAKMSINNRGKVIHLNPIDTQLVGMEEL